MNTAELTITEQVEILVRRAYSLADSEGLADDAGEWAEYFVAEVLEGIWPPEIIRQAVLDALGYTLEG